MICKYFLPSLRLFFYSDHCVLWLLTLFWMVSLEDYLQKWYKAYVESWQKNQSPVIRTDTQGQGLYEGVDAEPQGRGMLRGWRHNVFLLRVHICHWDWARHKATDGGQVIPGGHPRWLSGKQSACHCRRWEFISWVGKIRFHVVGDSLEFNQANRGSLRVWLGKRNCSGHNAGESGLISQRGERLMGFLELRQEPGVYSRVTAAMSIRNSSLIIEVRNLSRYDGQLRNVN